jgi:hypothetical protein
MKARLTKMAGSSKDPAVLLTDDRRALDIREVYIAYCEDCRMATNQATTKHYRWCAYCFTLFPITEENTT